MPGAQQSFRPVPGTVQTWRRKPLAIILILGAFAVAVMATIVLIPREDENVLRGRVATTCAIYVFFFLGHAMLRGWHTLHLSAEGICLYSLLGRRDLSWDEIDQIRWKYSREETDPLARHILLITGESGIIVNEQGFVSGDAPILESILQHWQGPRQQISQQWEADHVRRETKRIRRMALAYALLTLTTLAISKWAGWLHASWTWNQVLLAPALFLIGVNISILLPILRELKGIGGAFADIEDLQQCEIPSPSSIRTNAKLAITEALFRRVFPVPPDVLLPDEQVLQLQHRMTRLDQEATRLGLALLLPLVALFTYLAYRVSLLFQPPVLEPVLDTRFHAGLAPWLIAGFGFGSLASLAPLNPIFAYRYGREELDLFYRYRVTIKGYDTRRSIRWLYAMCVLFGVFGVVGGWSAGEVIDKNGIRFKPGLVSVYFRSYQDVQTIGIYTRHNAKGGARGQTTIQIAFRTEPPLRKTLSKRNASLQQWRDAAAYVSQRSGVPIEYGEKAD